MQLTMMNQLALIFIDGFLIYYLARAFVKKFGEKNKTKQTILIGIISSFLISSHYAFFTHFIKQQNYFEFYRVDRAYTSDQLNKKARQVLSMYHPDKNINVKQENFNQIMTMRGILFDPQYQKMYDRFGEFQFDEQFKQRDYQQTKSTLKLNAYINSFSFYVVFFIVSIVMSYGERFSKYRMISGFILLGLVIQEYMIFSDVQEEYDTSKINQRIPKFIIQNDVYDLIFPTYTIFERLQLIKFIIAALLTSLRLYFDCLIDEPVNKYEDTLDQQINFLYGTLQKQAELFEQNTNQIKGEQNVIIVNKMSQNKEIILKIKDLTKKFQRDVPLDNLKWIRQLFKCFIVCLFLYQLYNLMFQKEKQQSTQQNSYNQNNQQQYHSNGKY